jgi:hypothetical protein
MSCFDLAMAAADTRREVRVEFQSRCTLLAGQSVSAVQQAEFFGYFTHESLEKATI